MMKRGVLGIACLALLILSVVEARTQGYWVDLFNGTDTSDWTCGGAAWSVSGGILRNTRGYEQDWISYNTTLPSDSFAFEMRVRMVSGMRLRTHMAFDSIYVGNEGGIRQFEVYGRDITGVAQVGDDSYVQGAWYTLRLEVSSTDRVQLFKNGVLTHTAARTGRLPSQITVVPGDHWSPGSVEISSIRYRLVPEPSALAVLGSGLLSVIMFRRRSA